MSSIKLISTITETNVVANDIEILTYYNIGPNFEGETPVLVSLDSSLIRKITVNWNDSFFGEQEWEIFRFSAINPIYQKVGSVGANNQSFQDTGLIDGTEYTYKVRAKATIDAVDIYSNFSNELSIFTRSSIFSFSAFSTGNISPLITNAAANAVEWVVGNNPSVQSNNPTLSVISGQTIKMFVAWNESETDISSIDFESSYVSGNISLSGFTQLINAYFANNFISSLTGIPATIFVLELENNRLTISNQQYLYSIQDLAFVTFFDQFDSSGKSIVLSMSDLNNILALTTPGNKVGNIGKSIRTILLNGSTIEFDLSTTTKRLYLTNNITEIVVATTSGAFVVNHSFTSPYYFKFVFKSNEAFTSLTLNACNFNETIDASDFPSTFKNISFKNNGLTIPTSTQYGYETPLILGDWIKQPNVNIYLDNSIFDNDPVYDFIFYVEEKDIDPIPHSDTPRLLSIGTILAPVSGPVTTTIANLVSRGWTVSTLNFAIVAFQSNETLLNIKTKLSQTRIYQNLGVHLWIVYDGDYKFLNDITAFDNTMWVILYHTSPSYVTSYLLSGLKIKELVITDGVNFGSKYVGPTKVANYRYLDLSNNELARALKNDAASPPLASVTDQGFDVVSLKFDNTKWNLENTFSAEADLVDTLDYFATFNATGIVDDEADGISRDVYLGNLVYSFAEYNSTSLLPQAVNNLEGISGWFTDTIIIEPEIDLI